MIRVFNIFQFLSKFSFLCVLDVFCNIKADKWSRSFQTWIVDILLIIFQYQYNPEINIDFQIRWRKFRSLEKFGFFAIWKLRVVRVTRVLQSEQVLIILIDDVLSKLNFSNWFFKIEICSLIFVFCLSIHLPYYPI